MPVGKRLVHPGEVYKRRLLDADVPRRGDIAEIVRDCCNPDTGLIVHVVNDPHFNVQWCHKCGAEHAGYFVEIASPRFDAIPGPHFHPVKWLKRIDPRDFPALNARLDRQIATKRAPNTIFPHGVTL